MAAKARAFLGARGQASTVVEHRQMQSAATLRRQLHQNHWVGVTIHL
jgi:hypothetical protein